MESSWIVLLPPLVVLAIALIWRNVIGALFSGIVLACAIATNFSFVATIKLAANRIFDETNIPLLFTRDSSPDHVYTFLFLIFLGIIIMLITHSGGMAAYTRMLRNYLKDKKSVQTTSLLFSSLFFIDDYLNSLTVGSVMRPLTDSFKIPRAKLAFLLDAMSSPLCLIIPATSWVAMVIANLQAVGVSEGKASDIIVDPFYAYVCAIPTLFYPFFSIISAWFIVGRGISFGPMARQEEIAQSTGNLFGGEEPLASHNVEHSSQGSLLDFIIPIATFIGSLFLSLFYLGGWTWLGGNNHFLAAVQQANPFLALFIASCVALVVSIVTLFGTDKLTLLELQQAIIDGFLLMKNSLLVLLLAWTLGSLLKNDLHTGNYLSSLVLAAFPPFLLPVIIFLTTALICASTGSAWGTIAVMMPLAIPLAISSSGFPVPLSFAQATFLIPILGALLSGSIAGGHFSPIADSVVMASTSAGCRLFDHLISQLGYLLPALIGSCIAFIILGVAQGPLGIALAFAIGLALTVGLLELISRITKK